VDPRTAAVIHDAGFSKKSVVETVARGSSRANPENERLKRKRKEKSKGRRSYILPYKETLKVGREGAGLHLDHTNQPSATRLHNEGSRGNSKNHDRDIVPRPCQWKLTQEEEDGVTVFFKV